MWITFKSCIFAFWNNFSTNSSKQCGVVNYIQILYLCILKQPQCMAGFLVRCCELHSNLVSLHSETTLFWARPLQHLLWITFKSCIFAFWNNNTKWTKSTIKVVNYIQILYLCILKQLKRWSTLVINSCELHSNLVSLHSETTIKEKQQYGRSCELHSNLVSLHSETTRQETQKRMVRCELHSNLVSLHSETTDWLFRIRPEQLWITFKSCIFAFWNNLGTLRKLL